MYADADACSICLSARIDLDGGIFAPPHRFRHPRQRRC